MDFMGTLDNKIIGRVKIPEWLQSKVIICQSGQIRGTTKYLHNNIISNELWFLSFCASLFNIKQRGYNKFRLMSIDYHINAANRNIRLVSTYSDKLYSLRNISILSYFSAFYSMLINRYQSKFLASFV